MSEQTRLLRYVTILRAGLWSELLKLLNYAISVFTIIEW